jgi:RNA polymerase sigma-70 factor (ECF subfamily)
MGNVLAIEDAARAAIAAGDLESAATAVVEGYGDEIFAYLWDVTGSESAATEAFGAFVEAMWTALPAFREAASFRTWSYAIARRQAARYFRAPHNRAERALRLDDAPGLRALAVEVRSRTRPYLRTTVKDAFAEIRRKLDPDDQTLLMLRINDTMSWEEVARVLADEPLDAQTVRTRAAALRQRFSRLKKKLREMAMEAGLLD